MEILSRAPTGNFLREHGIEPVPQRKRQSTWKEFIEAHWDVLGAIDFTTIEVWTKGGLATFCLLFVMEVATRRVHFAGCTTGPDEKWMKQIARNLTDTVNASLLGTRYLLRDRDAKVSAAFRSPDPWLKSPCDRPQLASSNRLKSRILWILDFAPVFSPHGIMLHPASGNPERRDCFGPRSPVHRRSTRKPGSR